jgi:hypothetical protein
MMESCVICEVLWSTEHVRVEQLALVLSIGVGRHTNVIWNTFEISQTIEMTKIFRFSLQNFERYDVQTLEFVFDEIGKMKACVWVTPNRSVCSIVRDILTLYRMKEIAENCEKQEKDCHFQPTVNKRYNASKLHHLSLGIFFTAHTNASLVNWVKKILNLNSSLKWQVMNLITWIQCS